MVRNILHWQTAIDLLHLCFDHCSESGPVVVLKKEEAIFSHFFVDALFFLLTYCTFRYSCNKLFWGPWKFCENYQKCWQWLAIFLKTLVRKELIMWEFWFDHLLYCLEASNSWRSHQKDSCLSFYHFCLFSHNSLALWFWCMFHRRFSGAQPTRGLWLREVCSWHASRIQRTVCDSDTVHYSATSAACTRPPHHERSDISVKRKTILNHRYWSH